LTLTGQDRFEQFGFDLDLNQHNELGIMVAVSSPGKQTKLPKFTSLTQYKGGLVQVFTIDANSATSMIATFKSDRSYGSFGSKVQVCSNLFQSMIWTFYLIHFIMKVL
jgi:hypothetical protein